MTDHLRPNSYEIKKALRLILEPGQVAEARVLGARPRNSRYPEARTGYFDTDHLDELVAEIEGIHNAQGYYITLNPVHRGLHARAYNRTKKAEKGDSTSDRDIEKRRWILIDIDPVRPSGISSTEQEKKSARKVAHEVREWLRTQGWPDPLVIDSGNGFHLLYLVDLPTEDNELLKRCLEVLDEKFSTPKVKIDTSVYNPSRVTKIPGTPARKGDNTPDRPHRMSKLIKVPEPLLSVPTALLEVLAGPMESPTRPAAEPGARSAFNLHEFVGRHFPDAVGPSPYKVGKIYEINCPWRASDGRSAFLIQFPNGAVSAGCQHATCPGSKTTGNHWRDLRNMLEFTSGSRGQKIQPGTNSKAQSEDSPSAKKVPRHRQSLELLSWSDLKDKPVPEAEWLIRPLLPKVSFGIVASHPGHGKSILSLAIAVGMATGLPVLGMPTYGPAGAGVLSLEDDRNVIHRRLIAIRESYGDAWTSIHDDLLDQNLRIMVRARTILEALDGPAAALHLSGLAFELADAMRTTRDQPAVLFLDTLNAVHGEDENSNTETRILTATIFAMHDTLGCSIWALHHLKKTGNSRNPPRLPERMDPELVRGASALVGSARAVVQFGWVVSSEAERASLEIENCQRRYAILGLTKVNDGPLSPWLLLEHSNKGGVLVPTPDGEKALAILRGGKTAKQLKAAEMLLLDIHAGLDRSALKEKHYPNDPNAENKLKATLHDMRRRHQWLVDRKMDLTDIGLRKVKELGGQQKDIADLEDGDGR